jgi:arginine decarboxylase
MIPREFFVTSGKAFTSTSKLNAFDQALESAGLAQCNLVQVTSILPPGCSQIEQIEIPIGAITYAVISRMDGSEEQSIGAAIAWSWEKCGKYGIVAETHGYMDDDALLKDVEWKIREMARARKIELDSINYKFRTLKVPKGNYGCVVVILVYMSQ